MYRKSLLLLLMLITILLNGQNTQLQNEILNNSVSKSEIITKSRRLLLDKFVEGDYEKVKSIKDYLKSEVENQDYLTLYPVEYWLILYWTQEYNDILKDIENVVPTNDQSKSSQIMPQQDYLYTKLASNSRESYLLLNTSIRHSTLNNIDKDFLDMNLRNLIGEMNYETVPEFTQDTINALANKFLENYPESKYETFTKKYIRNQYKPSNFGLGLELFGGYGILTKELTNLYTNPYLFGIGFDLNYKKYVMYLRASLGGGENLNDVAYSTNVWEKEAQYDLTIPELSFGYSAIDNKRFKVTPFAGISSMTFGAGAKDLEKNPELEEVEKSTASYTFGLNTNIKLGNRETKNMYGIVAPGYWYVCLRYSYNIANFESKYSNISGNFHSLTVSFGVLTKGINKIK